MGKLVRITSLAMLILVIVAGATFAACSKGQAKLELPTVELYQYLKGTTGDLNDATLNQVAEGGGEPGYKFGNMKYIYPTVFAANKDTVAAALFGSPYKFGDGVSTTTYAQLTAGDQLAVDGTIFATKLSAAEQDVVTNALAGFFNRQEVDLSNAKALTATSFYLTLYGKVSQAAADGWKADIEAKAGLLYAGKAYADLTATEKQVVIAVADPVGLFYKALAGNAVYGEIGFRNGVAAATYPTLAEAKAQLIYSKAYKNLDPVTEAPNVDGAVYAALASYYPDDAARATARGGTAWYLKSLGYVTSDNYSALNYVEKARVDQALSASFTSGSAQNKERDYIDFFATPGAMLLFVAEMSDAVPLNQTICYLTLYGNVNATSAEGWKKDVTAGVNSRQAFYRWLAKEGVSAMGAAASLIQLGLQEFYFKIDNPNNYDISLDSLTIDFQVKASTGETVTAARQSLGEQVWVPAEQAINLRVLAPVKTMDVITWQVMIGKSTSQAMTLAADVWGQIQAGTAKWDVSVEATVSNEKETLIETYTLQWPLV